MSEGENKIVFYFLTLGIVVNFLIYYIIFAPITPWFTCIDRKT